MSSHGKKLLSSSSHFPLKSGEARGTPNFPRFRGIPRKSAESKVVQKCRVPARWWRPIMFSSSYGPRWRIPTDGCGPPTCESCDFVGCFPRIFRGKRGNPRKTRKNEICKNLGFDQNFSICQQHHQWARMVTKYHYPTPRLYISNLRDYGLGFLDCFDLSPNTRKCYKYIYTGTL